MDHAIYFFYLLMLYLTSVLLDVFYVVSSHLELHEQLDS